MKPSRIVLVGIICACAAGAIIFSILGQEKTLSVTISHENDFSSTETYTPNAFPEQTVTIDATSLTQDSPLEETPSTTSPYEPITE